MDGQEENDVLDVDQGASQVQDGDHDEDQQQQDVRRSSRHNLGQPPNRYGSWEENTPGTSTGQGAGAVSLPLELTKTPRPLFHSTPKDSEWKPRGGIGITPKAASTHGGDDNQSVVSNASSVSELQKEIENDKDELRKLEERVLLKAENLSLKHSLLKMQKDLEKLEWSSWGGGHTESYSGGRAASVVGPGEDAAAGGRDHFRPTPRIGRNLWKPAPTTDEDRQVPAGGGCGARVPPTIADRNVPAGGGPGARAPPVPKPRRRVQIEPDERSQPSLPSLPPPTGVDALAGAILTALQSQNQQTERFVARQSSSSALPRFDGNPLDWPLFAHHFRQSTQDCGFSPTQNMSRLEKALKGEARRTVRSLMIIPTNTEAVMERLEQRYGRPEYIIGALINIAKKTPTPKESKLSTFLDFSNAIQNLVTTVETLQVPAYRDNPQLMQELVEKLPDSFKIQWGLQKVRLGSAGANLLDFSDWVAEIAEASSVVSVPKFSWKEKRDESSPTTEEVPKSESDAGGKQKSCVACKKEAHSLGTCDVFKKMAVTDKWEFIKRNNCCFRCLRVGHSLKNCKSKWSCRVEGCTRRHHTLLHGNPPSSSTGGKGQGIEDKTGDKVNELNATLVKSGGGTILRIAVVKLFGPDGDKTVNALLDEGSTVTLLSADVAEELELSGVVDPLRIKWTDGRSQTDNSSRKVECSIGSYGGKGTFKLKNVRTIKNLVLPAQRTDLKNIVKQHPHLQTKIVKVIPGERPLILLGQQHIHLTVAREVVEDDGGSPMLTRTKLGWVLHGPAYGETGQESTFLCNAESDDDIIHNLVKESFALEAIGIRAAVSTRSKEVDAAEEKMSKMTHRFENGARWETGLLWREEDVELPPSRDVALRRLEGIDRKLRKDPALAKQYREKINDYLESGYARKLEKEELSLPSKVERYLPHFNTTHPNKPGKIWIVFDAASRAKGVSLNDYLLTGPDLLVSLPGVRVKMRQRKLAVGGDIGEMFHQIKIRPVDCPAQRFLWRELEDDLEPSTYQLEVVMFGSACSPYSAQYTKIRYALEFQREFPQAIEAIVNYHYMDDWLQSLDTEEEAIKLAKEVVAS